jgi:hypothetical protein
VKSPTIHIENLHIQLPRPHLFAQPAFNGLDEILKGMIKARATVAEAPEGTVINPTTGLMRAINPFGDKRFTFAEAQKAPAELRTGGFTDWRAPTLKELFAMTDQTRYKPAVNTDEYPDIASDWYWSSDVDPSSPSVCAFVVFFGDGAPGLDDQGDRGRALAVRSVVAAAGQ